MIQKVTQYYIRIRNICNTYKKGENVYTDDTGKTYNTDYSVVVESEENVMSTGNMLQSIQIVNMNMAMSRKGLT